MTPSPAVVNFSSEPGSVELREVDIPGLPDDHVLLRTAAVSVCGSDLHQWHGSHSWPVNYPVVLGHEFCGTIEQLGDRVDEQNSQFAVTITLGWDDPVIPLGQAGAENGKLTVMVGGAQDTFNAALAVMQCYGARVVHMGKAGTGQQAKMVNQICIAGVLQGLSEGLNFAIEAGLDTDALLEAISGGAAQSWQMVNRGQTMVKNEFDFGFALDWMRKDLRICFEEAERTGARLPMTKIVAGYYDELSAAGHGRNDTSALIRRLRNS